MNVLRLLLSVTVRAILPILLVVVGGWMAWKIFQQPTTTSRRQRPKVVAEVQVAPLERRDWRVKLESRGVVVPRTRTALQAELAARVVEISEVFRTGRPFKQGELLLRLDDREAELTRRRLERELTASKVDRDTRVVERKQIAPRIALARDEVRVQERRLQRAKELFEKGVGTQDDLDAVELALVSARTRLQNLLSSEALLKAQIEGAEQAMALARLRLEQARIDLAKARILAPYDGLILSREVDIGQFVSPGTPLATIVAAETAEVRLPLTSRQLPFLRLPPGALAGARSGEPVKDDGEPDAGVEVKLTKAGGPPDAVWSGRLVRVDAQVDRATRQLFVIAEIDRPFVAVKGTPLRLGAFVQAEIPGRLIREVYVVPRSAMRGEDELYLVKDGVMRRRRVTPLWQTAEIVLVRDGIEPGEQLCVSPIVFGGDSIPVRVVTPGQASPKRGKPRGDSGGKPRGDSGGKPRGDSSGKPRGDSGGKPRGDSGKPGADRESAGKARRRVQ